jgi:hypothetical protein
MEDGGKSDKRRVQRTPAASHSLSSGSNSSENNIAIKYGKETNRGGTRVVNDWKAIQILFSLLFPSFLQGSCNPSFSLYFLSLHYAGVQATARSQELAGSAERRRETGDQELRKLEEDGRHAHEREKRERVGSQP